MSEETQTEEKALSDDGVEIEIVDDTPEEDQGREERKGEPYVPSDNEIEEYSEGVQKRIKKLRYEFHEARRNKEKAERENTEAVQYAQRVLSENEQLKELITQHQEVLAKSQKDRLDTEIDFQRKRYKDAYEAGDADELASAQVDLSRAVASQERVVVPTPPPQRAEQPPPQQPQAVNDPKAAAWLKNNSWFGEHSQMTGYAYGLHEHLVKEGVDPRSDEYYEKIDSEMKTRFPEEFGGEEVPPSNGAKPGSVVAPVSRGNVKGPRKISLTSTQVTLAKRLGITPEQYAHQLLKEQAQ